MVMKSVSRIEPEWIISSSSWSSLIEEELLQVEALMREPPQDEPAWLQRTNQGLLNAGGKRIRPSLCLLSAGVFGLEEALSHPFAAATETLHTATLIHDDLLDGAATRRGNATLHTQNSAKAAVLIGDYLFARAAGFVAQLENTRVLSLFANTLQIIIQGELAQQERLWKVDRKAYFDCCFAKTAALFTLATEGAAALADVDAQQRAAIASYGRDLGLAFQIVDDMLDIADEQHTLGKPAGSDLARGLITLPAIIYYEEHKEDPCFQNLLHTQDGSPEMIKAVTHLIRTSGALERSRDEVRELVRHSQAALKVLPHSDYVECLDALAESVLQRSETPESSSASPHDRPVSTPALTRIL